MIKKILKKVFLCLIIILVLVGFLNLYQNSPAVVVKSLLQKGALTKTGNELIYTVKFLGLLPAANATIDKDKESVLDNREVYYLSAQVRASDFVTKFYKFSALIESYIDKNSKLPILFRQAIDIPGREVDKKEVFYDQQKHTMISRGQQRVILSDTYDPLSALYWIRHVDFSNVKEFDLNLNTKQKNYGIKGSVISLEKLSIKGKDFKVWVLKADIARRDKDNPYHRSRITMYLMDDANKTPILIKVMAGGAYIVARLTDIK